jgi:formate dehydrogenase major subunit
MTNTWTDIANANLILVMGGNAAEAHPCGFKWVTEAKAHNAARLIVVDPRFTRTASVADYYAPIRTGTDIAFMGGLINYLLTEDKIQHEYVRNYTDVSFIVKAGFSFEDGLFSGYDAAKRSYTDKSGWGYELGEDGFVKVDPTLQDPRCVYQLMKQHYSRYNIDLASQICGMPVEAMKKIWEDIATCSIPGKTMTILYALGWTQHSIGAQIIRSAAMVQLLLGNVGMPGGGVNALRGHSNIQGLTDLGLLSNALPGYLTLGGDAEQDYNAFIKKRTQMPLRPGQLSYWQNYSKFHVSLMKSWYGANATVENNWLYDHLPKLDIPNYDVLKMFDLMSQGKVNGYMCQGFNPIAALPDKNRVMGALAKLKWLVVMDPLATETSEFWHNVGPYNDVKSAEIQTEVIRLPTTCFAEEDGSLVNSSRWLQWHWKGADGPGEAQTDIRIMSELFLRLRKRYQAEGGKFPDPLLKLSWPYKIPDEPSPEELA